MLRHDFAVSIRQVLPLFVIAFIMFMVSMPVSTAAVPDLSVFNVDYTHDQLKWRFWASDLLYVVYFAVVVYGAVLGVVSFRFLLVRSETTAFLSLPIRRTALFGTRLGACALALVLGIAVPMAVSLVVNIAALGIWSGLFSSFAFVTVGLIVVGLVSCLAATLCCVAAGTIVEAVTFTASILASVTVAAWGLNTLMVELLAGNACGETLYNGSTVVADSLVQITAVFNPLLFFLSEAQDYQTFSVQYPVYRPDAGDWPLLIAWAMVVFVLIMAGRYLLSRRKGEVAGAAGHNAPFLFVVGIVVGLTAFGALFTLLANVNVVLAALCAFAAFIIVSLILFRGPLRGTTRLHTTLAVMGGESLCLLATVGVVATGGFGYSSYVPNVSQVSEVSVSYTGSPDYLAAGFTTATAGSGSYYYSTTYSFDDADDIAAIMAVQDDLIGTSASALASDAQDFGETVVPYDVVITYTMEDGSTVVRYYDRATYDELYALAELDGSQTVANLERAVIASDTSDLTTYQSDAFARSTAHQVYLNGSIYLSDAYYGSSVLLNCSDEAHEALLTALAEDVATQSVEDRYHPSSTALGILMFSESGQQDAKTFAYAISDTVIYLTDEFTNTLAWIEANGLTSYIEGSGSSIESLSFQRYDPYTSVNDVTSPASALFMGYRSTSSSSFIVTKDFGTAYTTSDATELAETLPSLRNTYFMNESGYLVCAKLTDGSGYAYFYLPDSAAPAWLLRVAG
jgi:ABC-2 type transport system permease protein